MGNLPIQRQWIWDWFASDANLYITYIVTIGAIIGHPILFGLHLWRKVLKEPNPDQNTSSNNKREASRTVSRSTSRTAAAGSRKRGLSIKTDKDKVRLINNIITITTFLSIAFGFIASVITLINTEQSYASDTACVPISVLQNVCWIITKLTIYQILILRLTVSFWGSVHEYNRTMMFCAYIIVTVVSLVLIIASAIDKEDVGVQSIHFVEGWCLLIVPTWLILLPCAFDLVCSGFACYLFIRVLNKLLAMNENNIAKNEKLLEVTQLMTKLIYLTIIAVASNLFGGIWFAITDIALFTYLDTVINPICLILMEAQHIDIYKFCCKYCHIGMHRVVHRKRPEVAAIPFMIDKEPKMLKVESNAEKQEKVQLQITTNATSTSAQEPSPQTGSPPIPQTPDHDLSDHHDPEIAPLSDTEG